MPFLRYFVVAGGLLLSLLFAADHYFPHAAQVHSAAEVDRSIIRISSNRPVPEKIVFDVSHQTPLPAASLTADIAQDDPPSRDALAMITPETQPAHAASEHVARPRQAGHSTRPTRAASERRLAFERREFPGSW